MQSEILDLQGVVAQLERLSIETRRWKRAVVVLSVALILNAAWILYDGLVRLRVVSAQTFVLSGSDGATRAVLSTAASGAPGLTMLDQNGKSRLIARLDDLGLPSIALRSEDERPRATIEVTKDGTVGVMLHESGGAARAMLSAGADGLPALSMYDSKANVRVIMALNAADQSLLGFRDGAGGVIWSAP